MKVRTNFVPEDIDYLTVGKIYDVEGFYDNKLMDDVGDWIIIRVKGCAHLNDQPWEIVEE